MKSFKNWDIYYLYDYAYSFFVHGDGDMFLIYFENNGERFCYSVMQRAITCCQKEDYFDWETPYGYGGPLTDGIISKESQQLFLKEITEYCVSNNIVSQFVRFHPLFKNYEVLKSAIETRYLRDTIYIDTTDLDMIMTNMDSKNRNMVRKAQKNGVKIIRKKIDEIDDFIPMYNETMQKNGADDYYIFGKEYFDSLISMKENAFILYAIYEDKPISGSIMYYNDRYMHYHLSGSHIEYRNVSPGNLLLYEAACMANEMGIKCFHLGGGMTPDDSLFGFKKQFNKNGRASFVVGRTIFDRAKYYELLSIRKKLDSDFDINNGFMIQYRR